MIALGTVSGLRLYATGREVTGDTMTRAVTEALRECYERLQRRRAKASVEELRAIAERAKPFTISEKGVIRRR